MPSVLSILVGILSCIRNLMHVLEHCKKTQPSHISIPQHFRTALHMACLVHHLDVAKQLLRSGTNVHMKDLLGD